MTALTGSAPRPCSGGMVNPALSAQLGAFTADYWPAHQAASQRAGSAAAIAAFPVSANSRALTGAALRCYADDYYDRIHLIPISIDLGNLVSAQVRQVDVWNAYRGTTQTLTAVDEVDTSGIAITAPAELPLEFAPLQLRTWQLSITLDGAPAIDAGVQWTFAGLPVQSVAITGQRVTAWTFVPDWSNGVTETLSWLTRVFGSRTAAEQRSGVRLSPRATFEFPAMVTERERALFDLSIYDAGARTWALPIWHDIDWLAAPLASGAGHIPTTGTRDFHAGGLAMLRGNDAFSYEVVEIESLDDTGLVLARPLINAWPVGTRLYPARQARLAQQPSPLRQTDNWWNAQVQFTLAESYDFPAAAPATLYRGAPVIEDVPEESDDLSLGWERITTQLDNDTGLPSVIDTAGIGFATPAHAWVVEGRDEHARLRGLLYYLAGRLKPVWLPTFAQDLEPVAPIGATSTTLDISFCGYTRFAQMRAGKRDIRIERVGADPLYRRITDSVEVDANTERLSLDSALGVALAPTDIARISYMQLVRLNSDDVEIQHDNAPSDDAGVTAIAPVFRALRDELELPA